MNQPHSDAVAFFGATGDLAYKRIFPALHAMARRGNWNFPMIGVAKFRWDIEELCARAHGSVRGVDEKAFAVLVQHLADVDGDSYAASRRVAHVAPIELKC